MNHNAIKPDTMNNAQELDNLAQAVREEGMNQGGSMKDLVFDPVTGEFRPVPRGTHRGEGDVVTEMTDKGFAAEESHEILVIREDDLENALKNNVSKIYRSNKVVTYEKYCNGNSLNDP